VQAQAVAAIVQAMAMHMNDPQLQQHACHALLSLSSDGMYSISSQVASNNGDRCRKI